MGKIFFKVFLCMVMIITVLTGCSGEKEENIEVINDSNSEEAEVETEQDMEEMIAQKVASITISTNGSKGYEEVLQKAKDAGIPIASVDSEISPEYRICHVSQADVRGMVAYLVQAAVLISLGVDYPENEADMKTTVAEALAKYSGREIVLGVLSAWDDTPVQNKWIACFFSCLSIYDALGCCSFRCNRRGNYICGSL